MISNNEIGNIQDERGARRGGKGAGGGGGS